MVVCMMLGLVDVKTVAGILQFVIEFDYTVVLKAKVSSAAAGADKTGSAKSEGAAGAKDDDKMDVDEASGSAAGAVVK